MNNCVTREKFDLIRDKYGCYASWAVWSEENIEKPKSNVGDLTILDPEINESLLSQLKPDVVLVGLNISRRDIKFPLANFHDSRPEATDYKIRFAFRGSPYWGGYMTDIIKDFNQKSSSKVVAFLKSNSSFEQEKVEIFRQEMKDLGSKNPTIIAFGNHAFNILKRNFAQEFKIFKVPHYAHYINKEKEVKAYFAYMRGGNLYTDREKHTALLRERRGLYAHLIVSSAVRTLVANILSLSTNNLELIRQSLESGDIQQQVNTYSKVVGIMGAKDLYDERYDYYWMGWRNVPHHYWLSKPALNILSKAR